MSPNIAATHDPSVAYDGDTSPYEWGGGLIFFCPRKKIRGANGANLCGNRGP